jgi:L-fucose mutarotase
MLKNIDPLLGPELLKVLRAMGHGDEIAIVDGNYPADTDAKRLVRMDGLDEVVPDCAFRPAAFNDPKNMQPIFAEFEAIIKKHEPKRHVTTLVGADFYNRVKACYAIVASSEARLYGNIVLRKGVIHPK